ncbi:MAG: hypothetical protein H6R27_1515, partial [Proteobacteria bacterium]|nr:hypothetical protein [Pseudomonadota bacterium]
TTERLLLELDRKLASSRRMTTAAAPKSGAG